MDAGFVMLIGTGLLLVILMVLLIALILTTPSRSSRRVREDVHNIKRQIEKED